MNRAGYVAQRFRSVLERRGGRITLRTSVVSGAPSSASINPPRYKTLRTSISALVGAPSLSITSDILIGSVAVGDIFSIGAVSYTATANASAVSNVIVVPISPVLQTDVDAGKDVTPTWLNDDIVPAAIAPYSRRLVDGTLIEARDLAVTISAYKLKKVPTLDTTVIFSADNDKRKVISIQPQMVEGIISGYVLQVR